MTTTLLTDVDLLDARGRRPDSWILLDGDRIAAVGEAGDAAPAADHVLALAGRTVTPGFIDLHGHGGGGAAYDNGEEEIRAALAGQLCRCTGYVGIVRAIRAAGLALAEA